MQPLYKSLTETLPEAFARRTNGSDCCEVAVGGVHRDQELWCGALILKHDWENLGDRRFDTDFNSYSGREDLEESRDL